MLILFTLLTKSQSPKIDKSKIIGTWAQISHQAIHKDSILEHKFQTNGKTYTFNQDGTFMLKYYGEASDYALIGNWKLSKDLRKIILFDNEMNYATLPSVSIKNQTLNIIKFTTSSFVVKELLPNDIRPGLSTYMKQ